MPSERKQFIARPNEELWERIRSLQERIERQEDREGFTKTDLLRVMVGETEKRYPPQPEPPRKRGRPRKTKEE